MKTFCFFIGLFMVGSYFWMLQTHNVKKIQDKGMAFPAWIFSLWLLAQGAGLIVYAMQC